MTYDQFVERPARLKIMIEHQLEDVELKWAICQTTTAQLGERVQTSVQNKSEKSYLKYAESKRRLDELSDRFDEARAELRSFLYDNLDPSEADVLEWKYIEGKSLQEIADIRNLTYQSMKNKAARAEKLMAKSLEWDEEKTPDNIGNRCIAYKHFEHEFCTWKYTMPHVIHSVADGTWRNEFERAERGE